VTTVWWRMLLGVEGFMGYSKGNGRKPAPRKARSVYKGGTLQCRV